MGCILGTACRLQACVGYPSEHKRTHIRNAKLRKQTRAFKEGTPRREDIIDHIDALNPCPLGARRGKPRPTPSITAVQICAPCRRA
jgi:hypothetical protein